MTCRLPALQTVSNIFRILKQITRRYRPQSALRFFLQKVRKLCLYFWKHLTFKNICVGCYYFSVVFDWDNSSSLPLEQRYIGSSPGVGLHVAVIDNAMPTSKSRSTMLSRAFSSISGSPIMTISNGTHSYPVSLQWDSNVRFCFVIEGEVGLS